MTERNRAVVKPRCLQRPSQASPIRLFLWPGGAGGTNRSAGSCCSGSSQCPWGIPRSLKQFPGAGLGMAAPCPGSVPCPTSPGQHSTAPTHRCRYPRASPSFGSSGAVRQALGAELLSDLLLPSTLPAARPPALPDWLHPLLPLSRADPREGQYARAVGLSKAPSEPTCVAGPARGSRGSGSHRAVP